MGSVEIPLSRGHYICRGFPPIAYGMESPLVPTPLFTYGSLMFPEVMQALLGRTPETVPAIAKEWQRFAFPGKSYPILVARAEARTEGVLAVDLTEAERALLNEFEHPVYRVSRIIVTLENGGESPTECRARAYTVDEETVRTLGAYELWDPNVFQSDLIGYLSACERFRENRLSSALTKFA